MNDLVRLDPGDAKRALRRFPHLDRSAAAVHAREGHVLAIEERLLIAFTETNELLGLRQAVVPFTEDAILRDQRALRHLVDSILDEGCKMVTLRSPPALHHEESGLVLWDRYVTKKATFARPPAEPRIGPVDASSLASVHRLLAEALVRGNERLKPGVELGEAERYVASRFDLLGPRPEALAIVASVGSAPVGHATYIPDSQDLVTGERFAEVVDVSVIDEYRNRGFGDALALALERQVAEAGAVLLGSVAREADGGDDLRYAALLSAGWEPKFDLWLAAPGLIR